MSIFISIASYRDPELINTIYNALEMANNPDDLVFGVVYQGQSKDMPDFSNINHRMISMHQKFALGAGFARSKAMELYDNEDYYLQIDSHTRFAKNWDEECITQLNNAKKIALNDKVILSYFPAPFMVEPNGSSRIPNSHKLLPTYPTKQIPFLNKKSQWTAKRIEFDDKSKKMPELSKTVLGGFIFADAGIVKEVPYDPEISFFGEEICFAMRAWTRGWDIYSPPNNIVYHYYHREGYPKIWKDRGLGVPSWKEIENRSKEKQKNVLCGIVKGKFGAGKERSLHSYESFINISFKKHYGLTKQVSRSRID